MNAPTIALTWGAASHVGLVRAVNEDALLTRPPVFLVADGMGGVAGGEDASRIVVQEFGALDAAAALTEARVLATLGDAYDRIRRTGGGGTTVAGVAVVDGSTGPRWLVFNLGDSRIYLRRDGRFAQISVDHSVVQEMIDAGAIDESEARRHPHRHVITRALGAPDPPDPDFWSIPATAGDRALVCSDGLTGEVADAEIGRLVATVPHAQELADQLVDAALAAGGRDNVSVVVVDLTLPRTSTEN